MAMFLYEYEQTTASRIMASMRQGVHHVHLYSLILLQFSSEQKRKTISGSNIRRTIRTR